MGRVRMARNLCLFGQVKDPTSTLQLLRIKGETMDEQKIKTHTVTEPEGVDHLAEQGWKQTGDDLCGKVVVKDFDGEAYEGKISWWHPDVAWYFVEYDDGDTETIHDRDEASELVMDKETNAKAA